MDKFNLTISVLTTVLPNQGKGKKITEEKRQNVLPETPLPDAPCLDPNPDDKQSPLVCLHLDSWVITVHGFEVCMAQMIFSCY